MLHRLAELDEVVRAGYDAFDFKRITRALLDFMVVELSAFYFDIRKDALYCDAPSSLRRKASRRRWCAICSTAWSKWLAPMLPFTMEEAWLDRHPGRASRCISSSSRDIPAEWRDEALAEKWRKVRQVRRVVTGALEIERANKTIGSSLEAAPVVHITDPELRAALDGRRHGRDLHHQRDHGHAPQPAPAGAFTLDDVKGVARGARRLPTRHQMRALLALHPRCRLGPAISRRVGARRGGAARTGGARPA